MPIGTRSRLRSQAIPEKATTDPQRAFDSRPCSGLVQIFFGDHPDLREEPEEERRTREEVAKEICESCQIQKVCLEWAVTENEKFGIWGGMNQPERRQFRKWLRKHGYEDPPTGDILHALLEKFRNPKKATRKTSSNGTRSVAAGNRANGVARGRPLRVAASANTGRRSRVSDQRGFQGK